MKTKHAKTGFDRYFTDRMKDREFAAAYTEARAGIDSVDAFVRSLDDVRSKAGVSKALLAKRTGTQPAAMRRLLTMDAPNPTLATVMSIVRSLGYSLALVPAQGSSRRGGKRKSTSGRKAGDPHKSGLATPASRNCSSNSPRRMRRTIST
jgi:DNA-binding phage protein